MRQCVRWLVFSFAIAALLASASARAELSLDNRYIRTPTGFLMVLRQGDNVFEHLKQLAITEQIPSASFNGIGFVQAKFGYWDAKAKQYRPRDIDDVELASMNGSIAWKQNAPSLHAHGVVTDKDFNAFGGHLLDLVVGTGSVEVTVTLHTQRLERQQDPEIQADILGIPH